MVLLCSVLLLIVAMKHTKLNGAAGWALTLSLLGWSLDSKSVIGQYAYILQLCGAAIFAILIVSRKMKNAVNFQREKRSVRNWVYVSVSSIVFVQLLTAVFLAQSLEGVIRFSLLAISVAFATSLSAEEARSLFSQALWLGSAITISIPLSALIQVSSQSFTEIGGARLGGFLGHPNYAAYVAGAVCLLWFVKKDLKYSRLNFWITLFCVLATQSRTAIIALIIGLLLISLSQAGAFLRLVRLGSVLGLLVLISGFGENLLARFTFIESSGGLAGENSSGWRIQQWQTALSYLSSENWLPVGWNKSGQYLLSGLSPHNLFLQGAMELGVLGLAAASALVISVIAIYVRNHSLRILIPLFVLASIFDAGFWVPSFSYFFIVVPLLLAVGNLSLADGISLRRVDQNSSGARPKPLILSVSDKVIGV
jgi:O-antigen ligase